MKTYYILVILVVILVSACGTAPSTLQAASTSTVPPYQEPIAPLAASPTAPVQAPSNTPAFTPTIPAVETPTPTSAATQAPADPAGIVIDHQSLALFDQLPNSAIQAAAQLRLMYRHASIGANMDLGLNCLANNFTDRRPNACGAFYDPKYDRSQWSFQFRGNPGWLDKVQDYVNETNQQAGQFDVFTFTLGYVDALDGSTYPEISSPENFQTRFIDPVEALEAAHPDKRFIWWTIPLARVDNANTQRFNDLIRAYSRENGKILMDIADIESHDPAGNPQRTERGYEVLDANYTDEAQSGHLNLAGRERLARALWVLMAQVAGWRP